jgi:F-type H+-transporting ATPase subunit b
MLIDWFTVGAQALNFLILVWLMKRFLYWPILHAIDEREKKIAAELADAAAKKAEAKKERDDFAHKNEEFESQRAALFNKAADEAKAEHERLLGEARSAADALSKKRQEALRNDARTLNRALAQRAQKEVFAIARKALSDLATTSLEERLGEVFTRRLREMSGADKERLGQALKTASEPAVVRSTFDIGDEQRAAIQNALNETFSADVRIRFETAPEVVSGIELTAKGQKVAWSIAEYLRSLENGVEALLKENDKPEPKAAPKPEANKIEAQPADKTAPKPVGETDPKAVGPKAAEPKPAESKAVEPKAVEPKAVEPKAVEPSAPATTKHAEAESKKADSAAAPKHSFGARLWRFIKAEPPLPAPAVAKPAAKVEAGVPPKTGATAEPKAAPAPAVKVPPEPAAKAAPEPAAKAAPEPVAKAAPEPAAKAAPEPAAKAAPEPAAKAAPEPAAKAAPEPVDKAAPAPVAKPAPKREDPPAEAKHP